MKLVMKIDPDSTGKIEVVLNQHGYRQQGGWSQTVGYIIKDQDKIRVSGTMPGAFFEASFDDFEQAMASLKSALLIYCGTLTKLLNEWDMRGVMNFDHAWAVVEREKQQIPWQFRTNLQSQYVPESEDERRAALNKFALEAMANVCQTPTKS